MYLSRAELADGLEAIRDAPREEGVLKLIVRRPAVDIREVLEVGEVDLDEGLLGDNWRVRGSSSTPDGKCDPLGQITVTSWRAMNLVARTPDRVQLAGDQLYVDLDIGRANLPTGTLLSIGTGVLEVTAKPHKGCAKFAARFGKDALRFVNIGPGDELRLRGINTRVVRPGRIQSGDLVKVERPDPAP